MARVLRDLALVFSGEELSTLKAPHFQVNNMNAVIARDPLDLEALAEGKHFPRNPDRLGNYHSGVGEILAMCERIADPGLSAFAYHPVPHFGLSFDMQRKKHEGVEEARGSRRVNFTLEFAFVLCCQPENLFIWICSFCLPRLSCLRLPISCSPLARAWTSKR